MSKHLLQGALGCALLSVSALAAHADVTLNIDAASRGPRIGNLQYGIFYEEINNAGDGGLYAELIRDRSFEDNIWDQYGWSLVGTPTYTIIHSNLLNEYQQSALNLKLDDANQGVANAGYWGINCVSGDEYTLSFWAKSDAGYSGTAVVTLKDNNTTGAQGSVAVTADGTWKKYTVKFVATASVPNAHFELTFSNAGSLQLDMVSLFPPTYKGRENGCRRDLALMLEDLHPAFVRFPGGCYIEGSGTAEENRRFEWKKTIGPVETRPGHYNYNWGYPSTDGLGFHEFLQLTEDLGAEPLFVVNIGLGHGYAVDYLHIEEYIQEALDALEYCNGDVNTYWGAQRAANGHPEPFNMRLLEIGNENYNYDDITSDHYAERYKAFYDAIKAKYPDVALIGNGEAWGTDDPSWRNSYPCEIIDEHYYRSPSWFELRYKKYDSYDRSKPKVYVGEYAVTQDYGVNGHLEAALGEAVYCLGMERNSDQVIMSSYAPIFMHEERGGGWMPDMIRFDHRQSYGTPSYWVQQLLPTAHGKQNVNWTEEGNLRGIGNKIALSSWSTLVKYDNVKVTDVNGNVIFSDDFTDASTTAWTAPNGNWSRTDGMLVQSSSSEQGLFYAGTVEFPSAYTLELDALKVSGAEGFLIGFNYADGWNYSWWNIGGWGNSKNGLQLCINNGKSDYDLKAGKVNSNQTYHLKIEVNSTHVKCYIDDQLIHDITMPVQQNVYVASSIDDDTNTMWLKIVNTTGTAQTVNINMANAAMSSAEVTLLTSASNKDENTTSAPRNVVPTTGTMGTIDGTKGTYEAPAYSLSIIKLALTDVNYNGESGDPATSAQIEAMKEELKAIISKLSFLHASTTLPITTGTGATIEWNLKDATDRVEVTHSRFSSTLDVIKPNSGDKKEKVATLTATVTFPDGTRGDIDIDVVLAPSDNMYGYLYAYMNREKEITSYALGSKEGFAKQFEALISDNEIFDTKAMAPVEGGTRDAYLGRGQRSGEYFITATDMSVAKTGKWENHAMSLLRSSDLIHWETSSFDFNKGKSIFSDPEATVADGYTTDAEYANIVHVWAPQFIWDPNGLNGQGAYLVYYSLLVRGDSRGEWDRIFYSYADKDFKTLTQPRLFYDPGYAVIDADIVYNEYDGLYHMAIKKEGSTPGIFVYSSPSLIGGEWTETLHMTAEGDGAVEGPTLMRRIDEDTYNLSYMRYDNGNVNYRVVDTDHLISSHSTSSKVAGTGNFQHGSIIHVTETEYKMLDAWSRLVNAIERGERLKKDENLDIFDEAIAKGKEVLENNRTVESLAEAIPPVLDMFIAANDAYMSPNTDDFNDITFMLANPSFNSAEGWKGSDFTAVNAGIAEQWNKIFDNYQELTDMPAGTYRLELQGFYRMGWPAPAKEAHDNGTEELLAHYYLGTSDDVFPSLYSETYSSYPDNIWGANSAFNTDHKYNVTPLVYNHPSRGTIRLGVKKTAGVGGDWCAFDNFKLYYKPAEAGVDNVIADGTDAPVNVYTTTGALVKAGVSRSAATGGLTPGIYIVGTDKVVVK